MSMLTIFSTSSGSAAVSRPRGIQRKERGADVRNSVARIGWRYDVFLNFRGEDTRYDFSDYLHASLKDRRVRAFRDDQDLLGEEIGQGLFQAIADSQIAILVISKTYGGSEWCLDELCHILRCRKEQRQVVLPVFYNVDASDVGELTGEFGEAFSALAKRSPREEVEKWKEALTSLAGIKGWSSREDADGRHGELASWVVQKVLRILSEGTSVFPISSPAIKKTLASQLRSRLKEHNISVFSDNDLDLIGKDLADETRNAMEHCKIYIPIISEDFASSCDCLDKLAEMFDRVKKNGQKILPIFYKMNPLKKEKVWDHFKEDMLRHNVKEYTHKRWLKSLKEIRSRSGLVSENIRNGDEAELIIRATKKVCELLKNLNA